MLYFTVTVLIFTQPDDALSRAVTLNHTTQLNTLQRLPNDGACLITPSLDILDLHPATLNLALACNLQAWSSTPLRQYHKIELQNNFRCWKSEEEDQVSWLCWAAMPHRRLFFLHSQDFGVNCIFINVHCSLLRQYIRICQNQEVSLAKKIMPQSTSLAW